MTDYIRVLLAKKEAVYGQWSEPTAADNTIVTRNLSTTPVEVDARNDNLDSRSFGATASAPSNERLTTSFEMLLAGSGAPGTAPPWMEVLAACGMAPPVLTAGASAVQAMGTPAEAASSLSLANFLSNQRRRGVGARGTFSLDLTAGAVPFSQVSLTALLPPGAFETIAPQPGSAARWIQPAEVNSDNTTIELDGYAMRLRSLRLSANVQADLRNLVGARYVNRGQHSVSGQLVIEAPTYVEKDFLTSLRTGAILPLSAVHGKQAGNTLELFGQRTQIQKVAEGEESGKAMWTLDILLTVKNGADDLIVTAR